MSELTKLSKYEIRRKLGKGAMGIVYEGFDPFIERTVAIKTILKSVISSSRSQDVLNRFRREAQAAGRLTHPKIVSIYEYGEDEDMAFIVMEFITGKELKEYFDNDERFKIQDSVRIMLQLLDALDYSHSRGVVHRDIKPANILMTEDGQIKVADFGIAKIESSDLTQIGAVLGTPTYMSPEQFMGLTVDHRSDIYSAGVILYQFLTGERPFAGSVITIMHNVLNQEPVPPSVLNHSVSKALSDVVTKAMSKRPEDRFQTASEFLGALKSAIEDSAAFDAGTTDSRQAVADPDATLVADKTSIAPPAAATAGTMPLHADIESWNSIKNSKNPENFRQYLKKYPAGEFIELARLRIAALEEAEARAQAEIAHRRNTDVKARIEKKMAEIRAEAAKAKADAEAERRRKSEETAHRARKEAEARMHREKKLAELMTVKDPHLDAERIQLAIKNWQLQAEAKRALKAETAAPPKQTKNK